LSFLCLLSFGFGFFIFPVLLAFTIPC
jgi:uncharacterized membrane protein YgaE (UPF0421/DUF939 family)